MAGAILDTFQIKRGDTLPAIRRTLRFSNGDTQDLTNATGVVFVYAPRDGPNPDFTNQVTRTANIIGSAVNGVVEYPWVTDDTDTVETFFAEFQVTFTGGDKLTFPNGEGQYILVKVTQDVDNA